MYSNFKLIRTLVKKKGDITECKDINVFRNWTAFTRQAH